MAKRITLTLLQFIIFVVLMMIGSFWALIRLYYPSLAFIPVWRFHVSANHDFVANGIFFALIFLVLFFLIEALRKALRPWASLSTLAFVLALMLSFAMKLGLVSVGPSA